MQVCSKYYLYGGIKKRMDDGSRWPLPGLVVLLLLFIINGIFYGFAAAVRNISENEIDKKAEEGDPKAKLLKELLEDPVRYVNAIPLIVTASGVFTGVFLVPWLTRISHRYIEHLPALILYQLYVWSFLHLWVFLPSAG